MASVLETGGNGTALLAKKQWQIFSVSVSLHRFCNFFTRLYAIHAGILAHPGLYSTVNIVSSSPATVMMAGRWPVLSQLRCLASRCQRCSWRRRWRWIRSRRRCGWGLRRSRVVWNEPSLLAVVSGWPCCRGRPAAVSLVMLTDLRLNLTTLKSVFAWSSGCGCNGTAASPAGQTGEVAVAESAREIYAS